MQTDSILQRTAELLTNSLAECSSRNDAWIFIVHHSLRVEGLVRQILAGEPPLPNKANLTLRAAAILHDIGSYRDGLIHKANHGDAGAQVVESLLGTTGAFLHEYVSPSELVRLIRYHPRGTDVPAWRELGILHDADFLDQVGAMSILQQASQGEYDRTGFYPDLYIRIQSETLQECETIAPRLFTDTARTILEKKRAFIAHFLDQLEEELGATRRFHAQYPTGRMTSI